MIEHTLPCGAVVKLDDEDAHILTLPWRLQPYRDGKGGPYVYVNRWHLPGRRKGILTMHRYILGEPPSHIDHINGDGLDNRRSNLRLCTMAENSWNCGVRSHSKSGIKGVMYESAGGYRRWRATVVSNGVRHRAYFDSAEDADAWARAKREELHGAFARHG